MLYVPRATLSRNIATLVECGFLDKTNYGTRYALGMRFVKIALTGNSDGHVIGAVASVMHNLVTRLGETTFMAQHRAGQVDLTHNEIPTDPSVSYIYPGLGPRPAHACSSAKAIAACILPELRDEMIETGPLKFNAGTTINADLIEKELNQVNALDMRFATARLTKV